MAIRTSTVCALVSLQCRCAVGRHGTRVNVAVRRGSIPVRVRFHKSSHAPDFRQTDADAQLSRLGYTGSTLEITILDHPLSSE